MCKRPNAKKIQTAAFASLIVLGLTSNAAKATSIDPLLWQQIAVQAEFIGVVECEVAGGVVARYKVIDSWKGAANGKTIRVRIAMDYWGNEQFAMALCGERYLIAGFKSRPANTVSTTLNSGIPLWWRQLKADVTTPLFQGRTQLPLKHGQTLAGFGTKQTDIKEFKTEVKTFLAQNALDQERQLLLALCQKYLFGKRFGQKDITPADRKIVTDRLNATKTCNELLDVLIDLVNDAPKVYGKRVPAVIAMGQEGTFKFLQDLKGPAPWTSNDQESIMFRLKWSLGKQPVYESPKPQPPSEKQLVAMREALAAGQKSRRFAGAFDVLTRHEPQTVVDYLMTWKNPNASWRDNDRGYFVGSAFAASCARDRVKHLTKLTSASNPYVKVAGAVYLSFEDEQAGRRKLQELSKLPGDPGVWAALTLARRGDKAALKRAIQTIDVAPVPQMAGYPHRNFQKRVIVLISNLARQNNLEPPKLNWGYEPKYRATYRELDQWLTKNERKLNVVSGPWLKELKAQKID